MIVVCKFCKAENEKGEDEYFCKCKKCGKITYYYVAVPVEVE